MVNDSATDLLSMISLTLACFTLVSVLETGVAFILTFATGGHSRLQAGNGSFDAALDSVRVRFRPVFVTAFDTIVGMIPIAFEQAVGLERLLPLADVAIGGLLLDTIQKTMRREVKE